MGVEVTEVVTKFSFQGSTAPLGKYNKQLMGAIKGVTAFATATYGALAGLTLWADNILKSVDPLAQLSRQTGIAVEAIQELGFASSVNGGSLDAMSAGLERLTARIGEAKVLGTGEGVEIFKKLGIDIEDASGKAKSADVVFDELRQSIVAMDLSQQEVGSIAEKLGLDPSAVQLLMKTNAEMAELRERSREFGILTQEQTDQVAEYNDSLTMMNRAMDGLKQEIAVGFAPQMTKLTSAFTDLIVVNRELISDVVSKSITVLVGFGKAFFNVAKAIFDVIMALFEFKPILIATGVAVTALMVTFFPITSIVAGIVGLILVVDDLLVALTGGKSIIGDFFKSFGLDLEYVGNTLMWVWDLFKSILTLDLGAIGSLMGKAFWTYKGNISPSEQAGGGTSNIDNRSVNQDVRIDIKTADPREAGRAVEESLQKQLNDAQAQTGHGGR